VCTSLSQGPSILECHVCELPLQLHAQLLVVASPERAIYNLEEAAPASVGDSSSIERTNKTIGKSLCDEGTYIIRVVLFIKKIL